MLNPFIKRRLPKTLLLFSLLLLAALFGRLWILQHFSEAALGCRTCVIPGTLSGDLPLLALVGAIFAISYTIPRRWWSLPWRCLAIVGLAVYLADVAVTAQFATRLTLAEARIYLGQPGLAWQQLGTQPWWQQLLAAGGLILLMALVWPRPRYRPGMAAAVSILLIWGSIALVGWAIPAPNYVHDWAVRNVIAANLDNGIDTPYSAATQERVLKTGTPRQAECSPGNDTRENIVVLVIESWSPYHSQLWSGLNDWTPELDRLASESIRLERLHAGGFTTNAGLISLLTGMEFVMPLTPPNQARPFEMAWGKQHTLPRQLAEQGYRSLFLTSGNLAFTRKNEWLEDIGFNRQEGHDYPGYAGTERLHFESVPDDILYSRALDVITQQDGHKQPHFTVVESVSSHHPFIHPYTQERDEEAVMRFVDAAAAEFIAGLRKQGFFDDGLLVVVSDHRAMTFESSAERKRLRRAAASRVPAFIMTGADSPRSIDRLFHQADLPTTLIARVSERLCKTVKRRDMLSSDAETPRCVMHVRGDQRDRIDVFCTAGEGTVKVDGDDSHFIDSEGLSAEKRQALLDHIARQRIIADET